MKISFALPSTLHPFACEDHIGSLYDFTLPGSVDNLQLPAGVDGYTSLAGVDDPLSAEPGLLQVSDIRQTGRCGLTYAVDP